jgi:NADH-quinone oxidoreductase subunit H
VYLLDMFFVLIGVFISLSFLTLLERKLLSYSQIRKAPLKRGGFGVLQPFADAAKLLPKVQFFYLFVSWFFFIFSPVLAVFFMIGFWLVMDCFFVGFYGPIVVLFVFSLFRLSVYSVFFIGYGSNSGYSFAGMVRSVSQTVSYEVNVFVVILGFCYFIGRYSFRDLLLFQFGMGFIMVILPLSFL